MKRLFYLLVFTFICLNTNAQNTDFEITLGEHFFTKPVKVLPLDNGETIVVATDGACDEPSQDQLRLIKLSPSGTVVWNRLHPVPTSFPCIHRPDAVLGTDNSIYVGYTDGGCDYFVSAILIKFDTEGNLVWTKSSDTEIITTNIKPAQEGGLWVVTAEGKIARIDTNGDIVQEITTPGSYFSIEFDYNLSTNDLVYAYFVSASVYNVVYMASDGTTQTINWNATIHGVHLTDEYIIIRQVSRDIYILDKQGNIINSIDIIDPYGAFGVGNDHIYLYKTDTLIQISHDLSTINSTAWTFGNVNNIGTGNTFAQVLGREYDHIYLKSIDTDLTYTDENIDIGIVDIIIDSTYIECEYTCFSFDYSEITICQFYSTGVNVVIENFGTVPVSSCNINSKYSSDCNFLCSYDIASHESYTFPALMPGQRDTLVLPHHYLSEQVINTQLCLYTTRPNEMLDRNHDNDRFCSDFTTSINPASPQLPLTLFPNPATDIINIQSDKITNWQEVNTKIIAIDGQQIEVTSPQIDVSTLPAGVYILNCEYDGLSGSRRFVKY